ncbi:complement factor H-like [Mytilus trossulus]|uniref:complement factor H-like n=1 Tax=Mytilus trossulus TaxID=6551 RepID=UPI00300494B5
MTVEMCVQLCMGNRYLGLQYSFECFCGDSLGNSSVYNETNDSECNRKCQGNASQICGGDWRNSVYQYDNCTLPGLNEFTVASTNTNVVPSTEVTYTCEFGYQLPAGDLGTRICQLGGTWPAPPPACEVIKCTAPEINEFTITSTNTDVVPSTEVTYTCEFGYQLPAGELGIRVCQLGGTWPAPPPACEVIKCTAPEINEFTITSTNTDVMPSTEVTYTCEFGYQLPAGEFGTIGEYVSSVVNVMKCTAPDIDEFTITSTNTDVVPSTEVTYTCKFGYQLPAGELGSRVCQLGGTWPVPLPACEVTPTSTEEIMTSSEVTSFATSAIIPLECLCPCSLVGKRNWGFAHGMNLTFEELREMLKPDLDLLKKELSVTKSNTSRMRRSKISATDDRVSATSIGYVGVVFICLITVMIVFLDILGCFAAKLK